MGQTHDEITQNLAERLCEQVARRDATRVARRLYRKQPVDGVDRLDEGAVLDDLFHLRERLGVMVLLEQVPGAAIQRAMVPYVQEVLLDGLQTWFGIKSMKALPPWLCSAEAVMPWVGCKAQPGRPGICQRGATKRQGERAPGPIGPDTLAKQIVTWHVRDREAVCKGSLSGVGASRGRWREGHGDGGWHRSGDHGTQSWRWASDPEGPPRGQSGAGARDRGDGLRREGALVDRGGHQDAPGGQGGGRFRSMKPTGPGRWSRRRGPIWLAMPACTRSFLIEGFGMVRIGGGWTSRA